VAALALIASVGLPWILGIALLRALPGAGAALTMPGSIAWTVGAGWFAGALLLTFSMRALALITGGFGLLKTGSLAFVAAAILVFFAARRDREALRDALHAGWSELRAVELSPWRQGIWFALLGWLALRALLLFTEIVLRPLFPWEAWTRWATKARVYYELGTIVPFGDAERWLAGNGALWFDAGPREPATVPLLQAWTSLVLGRWDDVLIAVPWWIAGMALSFAVFGALRLVGMTPLPALVTVWIMASLPLLDTHVALAGYADLYVAGFVTLGALALLRAAATRVATDVIIALLFLSALPLCKGAGALWIAALLPGFAVALWPARGARIAVIALVAIAGTLLLLARTRWQIGDFALHLDFAPAWSALVENLFLFDNWHLLWYAAAFIALVAGRTAIITPELLPLTVMIGGGLAYAFIVFAFPAARTWFGDITTMNRTVLALAPLVCIWLARTMQSWTERGSERRTTPPVPSQARG
jgi:hypothetical protein